MADERLTRSIKDVLKRRFPSLWVRWHLSRCAVEPELSLLQHVVPRAGVAVDIGANFGLYTRELARIAAVVHAFEPSNTMAGILRNTSARNVIVHEMALSDHSGEARLRIPKTAGGLIHSLASVEQSVGNAMGPHESAKVPLAPLDSIVQADVAFVKIDVEGHELKVLEGARGILKQSRPIFLVEAEERHRPGATNSLFQFFSRNGYQGFFLKGHDVLATDAFDAASMQDDDSLFADGSRKPGRHYVNNFFFFPKPFDGKQLLLTGLQLS
jgi:FkbM family methyltransferase